MTRRTKSGWEVSRAGPCPDVGLVAWFLPWGFLLEGEGHRAAAVGVGQERKGNGEKGERKEERKEKKRRKKSKKEEEEKNSPAEGLRRVGNENKVEK